VYKWRTATLLKSTLVSHVLDNDKRNYIACTKELKYYECVFKQQITCQVAIVVANGKAIHETRDA